jgi:hypothetical protein
VVTGVLCSSCRDEVIRTALAALDVMGDPAASTGDRGVAADVAVRAVETLQLPPGEVVLP